MKSESKNEPERENLLVNLLANIVVPALLLTKGAKIAAHFGIEISPLAVLIVALAFPLGYFWWDFLRTRKTNFLSVLGFAGTLLTGGIGLFRLSPLWVAVKEAAIPLLIAIVLLFSRKLVRQFLFNEKIFDVPAIEAAVRSRGNIAQLDAVLKRCSRVLTASFFLSAILNFALARIIVKTDPAENDALFNEEIGEMMALSWPVIVLPCMVFIFAALWILLKGLEKTSGLPTDSLFKKK